MVTSPVEEKQVNMSEARRLAIQRCIMSVAHASECRDNNCGQPSCQKMKKVLLHSKNCLRKLKGDCPICKQLISLCCYHVKRCHLTVCPMPFCKAIKRRFLECVLVTVLPNKTKFKGLI